MQYLPSAGAYPCRQAHVTLKQVQGDGLVAAERNASGRHFRRHVFCWGYYAFWLRTRFLYIFLTCSIICHTKCIIKVQIELMGKVTIKIIKKDGNGIEITPPHVATEHAMAIAIAEKNKIYRQIAAT